MASTSDVIEWTGIPPRMLNSWRVNGALDESLSSPGSGSHIWWQPHQVDKLKAIGVVYHDLHHLDFQVPISLIKRIWTNLDDPAVYEINAPSRSVQILIPEIAR